MIAYFPEPYADESWYSLCARFSDRTKFGTETGTMQALYGSRHAIATVDLPHRLGALVSQLPPGHPCTVDTVIDQHTFLPYYGPFLTTSTYVKVRDWMGASTKARVRVKCGACTNRVRPPKYFRSCPECDRENRETLGETYWHRLFQVPGVEVCPVHKIFLEPSDIRLDPLPNRHKYFPAELAHLQTKAHAMDPKDPAHRILHDLARRIDWLLQQDRLNPGLEILHQQHRVVLASNGFATQAGSVRMNDLRREVIAFFGTKLLDLLQCGLPDENGDGWLGQMLRKSNTAAAPLRHLLLLQAMEVDLEHFFYPHRFGKVTAQAQTPTGPWPCLNAVCEHRGRPSIGKAEPQPPDTNGTRHIVIGCPHCGFAYQLRHGSETPNRASHVIDYGTHWKDKLSQQWADPSITLRGMAKTLGVDPKTVKQRAVELGLPFPREGKRPVTKRGLYVVKQRDQAKSLQLHQQAWAELRGKHPTAGTKELRSKTPALYAWLYRNDRLWLKKHQPSRRKPPITRVYVDWAKRDEELAGQVATAATHIKHASGKPRQVTTTAIGRVLGKQSLFEAALAKLPLTRDVIRHLVESGIDFAVRRVHVAAAKLRQTEWAFPRWRLVRAAGLHYRLERLSRVKQALDYEMRPRRM
jgi:Tn7-like transposition protein D/TniQ